MKTTLLIAASALTLAGCQAPSSAVTKLDCPATEGDLARVSISNDGKTCAYRSPDGAEVTLELIPVVGDAQTTLARIETALRSNPGPADIDALSSQADVGSAIADAAATKARVSAMAAEVSRVQAEAAADAGIQISAGANGDGNSDTGRIDLPGVHISGDSENANVQIGPLSVEASGDDTTINIYRDVRMRGEALSREKRGLRATFIYTGEDLPAGYRYIGYEAGGPKTGPLTVAKVRSKAGTESGDNINQDVRELVRRNGGV
jgi:hypothetical protein